MKYVCENSFLHIFERGDNKEIVADSFIFCNSSNKSLLLTFFSRDFTSDRGFKKLSNVICIYFSISVNIIPENLFEFYLVPVVECLECLIDRWDKTIEFGSRKYIREYGILCTFVECSLGGNIERKCFEKTFLSIFRE